MNQNPQLCSSAINYVHTVRKISKSFDENSSPRVIHTSEFPFAIIMYIDAIMDKLVLDPSIVMFKLSNYVPSKTEILKLK